ncbi:MAG: hypothetical protein AAF682_08645 [Planctomycetota bacterium]
MIPATEHRVKGRPAAAELLARGGPREILARIVPDDPLELRARVARRARERALLLDVDRACLRTMALCAARAVRYRGRPRLDLWLRARVEEVLDGLLDEERQGVAPPSPAGEPPAAEAVRAAGGLAARFDLAPDALAAGCARFHRLSFADRDAFLRLVVEAAPLDATARALGTSATELARGARRALCALLGRSTQADEEAR